MFWICIKNEPKRKRDDYCTYLVYICFYYDNSHGKLQIKITFEKFDL